MNYRSPNPWASGPHLEGTGGRTPASPRLGGRTPAGPGVGGRTPASPGVGVRSPASPSIGRTPATPDLGRAPAAPSVGRTPASPTAGSALGKSSRRVPSSSSAGKSGGKGKLSKLPLGGGGGGGDAEAAVVIAVVAVAAAGGILAVHASTEGGRYDGWVSLPPEQAVLVERHNGTRYWVPLSDLSPEDSRDAERGLIIDDGGGLERLRRARLKRSGFVYSLEAGAAQTSAKGGVGPLGVQSRLGLGTFFMQELGAMVGGQFSAADRHGTVFNGRLFAELQVFPFAYRRFHFGFYGEAGYAWALHDAPGRTHRGKGFAPGAGALLQYDLTTRLAASLRGGTRTDAGGERRGARYPNRAGFQKSDWVWRSTDLKSVPPMWRYLPAAWSWRLACAPTECRSPRHCIRTPNTRPGKLSRHCTSQHRSPEKTHARRERTARARRSVGTPRPPRLGREYRGSRWSRSWVWLPRRQRGMRLSSNPEPSSAAPCLKGSRPPNKNGMW